MDNETEYRIKKAQHLFYRRGQLKELRGFNTAIRLFSGGDDDKPSFWKRHKGKLIAAAALAGLGGLAYANRDKIDTAIKAFKMRDAIPNSVGEAGAAPITKRKEPWAQLNRGELTSRIPVNHETPAIGPHNAVKPGQKWDDVERGELATSIPDAGKPPKIGVQDAVKPDPAQQGSGSKTKGTVSAMAEKTKLVSACEQRITKEMQDGVGTGWSDRVLKCLDTTVTYIESNPDGFTNTLQSHLLFAAKKAKSGLRWEPRDIQEQYAPEFDTIVARIADIPATSNY